jgi:uroporphyrin-III C-methyltransferase
MTGKVYLVGAGPGSPDLLTLRAKEVLEKAEVVLYDQLAMEIIRMIPEGAERIDCGKSGSRHTMEQGEIEQTMVRKAREGKRVVRLKGGDPFLFGRGGEELEALREHGIPVELVPGVTSAIAVPGCAGIPVTHRGFASQVTFVTGHEDPTKESSAMDWKQLAASPGTLVILMGVRQLPSIAAQLRAHGMAATVPVAVIERGLQPDQRVTTGTLGDIAEKARSRGVRPPAVIVIGDVVKLWREENLCGAKK